MNGDEDALILIQDAFNEYYPGLLLSDSIIDSIDTKFSPYFNGETMASFMDKACDKTESPENAVRYFCGMCWKNIKDGTTDRDMFKIKMEKMTRVESNKKQLH